MFLPKGARRILDFLFSGRPGRFRLPGTFWRKKGLAPFLPFLKKGLAPFLPFRVYTDGSWKGKWGSWAFVVVRDGTIVHEASGRESGADSQRMEFQAVVEALSYLPPSSEAHFYTDSRVVYQAALGIKKPARTNQDQLLQIQKLSSQHNISWSWVKAHAGNVYNERCDELCVQARS